MADKSVISIFYFFFTFTEEKWRKSFFLSFPPVVSFPKLDTDTSISLSNWKVHEIPDRTTSYTVTCCSARQAPRQLCGQGIFQEGAESCQFHKFWRLDSWPYSKEQRRDCTSGGSSPFPGFSLPQKWINIFALSHFLADCCGSQNTVHVLFFVAIM